MRVKLVKTKKSGFTLIELVVALSLVTAMTGIVMAQFRTYNQRQASALVSERMTQVFNEAKNNALAGVKDCNVCGGSDHTCNNDQDLSLLGWRVTVNPGGINGYEIKGICAGAAGTVDFFVRKEEFPSNVTVSTLYGSPTTVLFEPLNGGTDLPAPMYVGVTGSEGGTKETMVSAVGEIQPPAPTPTLTPVPTPVPTNTPIPPPPACDTIGGKCVPTNQSCTPVIIVNGECQSGYKCVYISATCTEPGSCTFPNTCRPSCTGTYYPCTGDSCGTCPGSKVCCSSFGT